MNILVIDDHPEHISIIKYYLKKTNYIVDGAEGPYQAIHKLNNNKYDLVILDIFMPEMSGVKLGKIIKEKYGVPILILSSMDRSELDKLEFKHKYQKPQNSDELIKIIDQVVW